MNMIEQVEKAVPVLADEMSKLGYDTSYTLKGRELAKLYLQQKNYALTILQQDRAIQALQDKLNEDS